MEGRLKQVTLSVVVICAIMSVSVMTIPLPQRIGNSIGFVRVEGHGDTNIPCDKPGSFVQAPDGCNRCYCEQDYRLSSTCSRAICPPGYPSGGERRVYPSYNAIRFIKSP